MSETREARNFVDKSKKAARQAFEKGSAAIKQNFSSALEKTRDVNVKLIEMARHSAEATFELAHDIAMAKDAFRFRSGLNTKQFELFNMQLFNMQMSEFGILSTNDLWPQDGATRSFTQTFKGGS